MSLVLILDVFFILNQLGYCLVTVSNCVASICNQCQSGFDFQLTAMCISDLAECLSHSLQFYFYVRFSTVFREQFFGFVCRMRKFLKVNF